MHFAGHDLFDDREVLALQFERCANQIEACGLLHEVLADIQDYNSKHDRKLTYGQYVAMVDSWWVSNRERQKSKRKAKRSYGLYMYRYEALRAAKELGYDIQVHKAIRNATTEGEIARIMITARRSLDDKYITGEIFEGEED